MSTNDHRTLARLVLLAGSVVFGTSLIGTASAQDDAPPPQNNPSMSELPRLRVGVLYGGWIIEGDSRRTGAQTWMLGSEGWQRVETQRSPGPRAFHCSAPCDDGNALLLFGGSSGGTRLSNSWRFDGTEWSLVAEDGPPARSSSRMAFDPARQRVVMFGGRGEDGLLGDTWEWDGERWLSVAHDGPRARRHHGMAFDPGRGGVILFGGATDDGPSAETWRWDGTDWSLLQPAHSPPARDHHAMASDPEHRRVVIFGGWDGESELGDTWAWDGEDWKRVDSSGPTPDARGGCPALLFDHATDGLILYGGGLTENGPRTDVWRLQGDRWHRVSPAHDLSPDSE